MSKKFLICFAISAITFWGANSVQAYPSDALFGGGYSGVRHIQNQAQYTDAVNEYSTHITTSAKDKSERINTEAEKNVSSIRGRDGKFDYNPYTGHDSGVNESKSIYTDDLGRLHFFGKANRFKDSK